MPGRNSGRHIWVAAYIVLLTVFPLSSCIPAARTTPPPSSSPPATATYTPGVTATPPARTTNPPSATVPALNPSIPTLPTPSALISSRTALNSAGYVVFAWNDLGMHCANPSYDKAVLLPPYNNLWAQVVKRGSPPQVVTTGLTVDYRILNNTYSYGKGAYKGFWDNAKKLFGIDLAKDRGLNLVDPAVHNGLSGTMLPKSGHFEADGIPVTPINDDGTWNPYQAGQVTVKDASGRVVAQTWATVPVSDEINCARCHGSDAFGNILAKHDRKNGTGLAAQAPVLCASCHGDPALGTPKTSQVKYLSDAVHGFHAGISTQPECLNCHPGQVTRCSRSLAHTAAGGNCQACHGSLGEVSASIRSGRVPWVNEPKCVTCHKGVAEVDTGAVLYRNDTGHGGLYCASCHSSPHAMVPTSIGLDNYQALQYQGAAKTIGSCGACHRTSKGGGDLREFAEEHGGINPEIPNACAVCHTSVPSNTSRWPHQFQWQATPGKSSGRGDR